MSVDTPRYGAYKEEQERGKRMRPEVQSVYNRQVAKCLSDICEVIQLPTVVESRIKLAIEYTCKDIDKLRLKTRKPNGETNEYNERNGNH